MTKSLFESMQVVPIASTGVLSTVAVLLLR
jgi:hypothetical protein